MPETRGDAGGGDEGRIGALARRIAEAALLLAAVCVPLFAQPNGARGFEGDRFVLLRLLGLLALVGVMLSRTRHRTRSGPRGPALDLPLGLACVYVGASLAAAFLSEVPSTALPGSYGRQAGLLSDLALLGLFVAARRVAAGGELGRRVVDVLVYGGGVVAALALAQTILPSLSPELVVPYLEAGARATSISGGPTFLGSHLAGVLPLAVATATTPARRALALLLAVALLVSGSRAACFAALVGVTLVVAGVAPERRRPLRRVLLAVLGVVGLACLPPVRAVLPAGALPNRIVQAVTTDQGETRGRLYANAVAALGEMPARLVVGHGPDSTGVTFAPAVGDELQRRIGGAVVVDRLHCDLLDVVWTRGLLAALGLFGLIAVSLVRVRRLTREGGADRTLVLAWGASVAAVTLDGLLSVPGAVSRIVLFVGAGWLAGRAARGPTPEGARPLEPAAVDAARRGVLIGAGATAFAFAVGATSYALLAAPLLLLLPRTGRPAAWKGAALAFVPFLLAHVALDPAGATAFEAVSPETSALRGRLDTLALLAALALAVFWLVRRHAEPPVVRDRPVRVAGAVLLALTFGALARDDVRRLLADVDARVAYAADREARRSDLAAALLERAAERAPEVPHYRTRAAFALADHALRPGDDDPEALLLRAGTQVGLAVEKAPRNGPVRAQAAAAVLLFTRATPARRHGLTERAWSLVEPAVTLAPTSVPVLQIAAELALARGDLDRATTWLERALAIDAAAVRSWLLKGRAEAARRNLSGAAFAYGKANVLAAAREELTGTLQRPRLEALAGLALASAATERTSDAATLVNLLAARAASSLDFASEVDGARPLLFFVKDHAFAATFEEAKERFRGPVSAVETVEAALTY